jgi:hypothetical protein
MVDEIHTARFLSAYIGLHVIEHIHCAWMCYGIGRSARVQKNPDNRQQVFLGYFHLRGRHAHWLRLQSWTPPFSPWRNDGTERHRRYPSWV